MQFKLMATMAAGLEAVTAKELQQMGYKTQTENGRVYFEGDETDIVRTNVWLRSADRIKIILKQFKALTFDGLFEGVKSIPWADYLPLDAAFPVAGRAVRSKLHSEPDVQAITKKKRWWRAWLRLTIDTAGCRNGQQVPTGSINSQGHCDHHYRHHR